MTKPKEPKNFDGVFMEFIPGTYDEPVSFIPAINVDDAKAAAKKLLRYVAVSIAFLTLHLAVFYFILTRLGDI